MPNKGYCQLLLTDIYIFVALHIICYSKSILMLMQLYMLYIYEK